MIRKIAASVLFLTLTAGEAAAAPDLARAMIDAAARTHEPAQVAAVANAARAVFPDSATEIDAYAGERIAAIKEQLRLAEELIVKGEPREEEAAPPPIEQTADAVELKPGRAPEFLKLGAWDGKIAASGLLSSGNSNNKAFGVALEARREHAAFKHTIRGYADYGTSNNVKSQQRWGAGYQLDYQLGERSYAFGRLQYDEDEFSGFDYKLFAGLGFGHFLFKETAFSWKMEGGPGYQYAPIDDTRAIDQHAAFYGASEIDWIIREGLKFEQDINATWTEPTTTVISTSALTSALTDTLSAGLSFRYRYESSPPLGRLKEDRTFRATLNYGF